MAKGRDISAENLSDVLELIRRRQQSGTLSVEHYRGGILEEGELYFHDGQITYAKTGQLSNQAALYSLLRWRQVLFSFQGNAGPTQSTNASTAATKSDVPNAPDAAPSNINTPGVEWIIPSRLNTGQDVLSLPLTRTQRSMYLLVDGQRSLSDLARCTRKNLQEVEQLLLELQQRGLIAL
jgi:hypothetical protein